jgi:hypothetical protein
MKFSLLKQLITRQAATQNGPQTLLKNHPDPSASTDCSNRFDSSVEEGRKPEGLTIAVDWGEQSSI